MATKSLEDRRAKIRLLNVRLDTETAAPVMKATVYIPKGQERVFLIKAEEYAQEFPLRGKPKNNALISSIEDIKLAVLESFWIGSRESMPGDTPVWYELWLRYDFEKDNAEAWRLSEENITLICSENEININDAHIIFPERIVKIIQANAEQLKLLIVCCPYIAEIRRAPKATTFFQDLSQTEGRKYINELLKRTAYSNNNTTICLLDTGITASHPLLAQSVNLNHV